jgi:hypothetical protein
VIAYTVSQRQREIGIRDGSSQNNQGREEQYIVLALVVAFFVMMLLRGVPVRR